MASRGFALVFCFLVFFLKKWIVELIVRKIISRFSKEFAGACDRCSV